MNWDRAALGIAWGVAATVAKSVVTMVGFAVGESPEPTPMPVAVVERTVGAGAPRRVVYPLAAVAHLAYGGLAGAAFATAVRPASLVRGVAWGAVLWIVQQTVFFPLVGWGAFGRDVGVRTAVAALVDHLVFGYVLGTGLERADARASASR